MPPQALNLCPWFCCTSQQIGMWPHYRFVKIPARDRPHRNERSP